MKSLYVYLYDTQRTNVNMYHDLDSFLDAVEVYKPNHGINLILNTTCLAALNFDYFKIFDEIKVIGRYKYTIFTPKNDKDHLIKSIIENHTYYTNNNEEIENYCKKEIRYAHNLYNLILRGLFNLNEKD